MNAINNNVDSYQIRSGLKVNSLMVDFIENEVLPGLSIDSDQFWNSFAQIVDDLTPENRALLAKRDEIQARLDLWNKANKDSFSADSYKDFLYEIGYLVTEGEDCFKCN